MSDEGGWWDSEDEYFSDNDLIPHMPKDKLTEHMDACRLEELQVLKETLQRELNDINGKIDNDKDNLRKLLELATTNNKQVTLHGCTIFGDLVRNYDSLVQKLEDILEA